MENLDLSFILLSFSSLFTLLNPIGTAPIVLSLTESLDPEEYNKVIKKSVCVACLILLLFAIMGKIIFTFYGITVYAFKIAGGILFLRIGINMLEAKYLGQNQHQKNLKKHLEMMILLSLLLEFHLLLDLVLSHL